VDKLSTTTTPLQQAAELLERCQQLLQATNAEAAARATTDAAAHPTTEAVAHPTTEAAAHATTAARVRRMPTAELRRDPVLWVAYTRGWDDHAVVYTKSTNVGPKPAVTDRSQSSRRPVQPARTPRPPPMPQSTRLPRPTPQPLMAVLVPRPKSYIPPPQNSWQRRNLSRMREYQGQQKAANPTTSQQYRLEKPAPSTTQPAPGPKSLEATTTPVPEAKTPEVAMPTGQTEATEQPATSIPVDMKISPDEEKELLCDMTPRYYPDMGRQSGARPLHKLSKPATDPPTHPPEAAGQPPSLFCDWYDDSIQHVCQLDYIIV
jgi:hypothetical protein